MSQLRRIRDALYWWLFPGMNLHARLRYRQLSGFLGSPVGEWTVLDAGCGNGMLAYQAYLRGARVLGVSIKQAEVVKARWLFNEYRGVSEEWLRFETGNLYELYAPEEKFDAIICAEVLEHLKRDQDVCESFFRILKPGGVAHICAPNAEHPYNRSFPLDPDEIGGHVRAGYTERTYRELLQPLGFRIEKVTGLGGPIRQAFNRRIKNVQSSFGATAGLPLFLLALAVLPFERRDIDSATPFSIYVKARKPLEAE